MCGLSYKRRTFHASPKINERATLSDGIWDVKHLRFATEAAGVGLWSWNVDTDKIILDDRGLDLWGLPRAPAVTFEELSSKIHVADLDKVHAAFAATRERIGAYETDFRILVGNEVRWISARGRGDDEGIVGRIMYGVFIDVSVRKRAEEARELITREMHSRTTTTKEVKTRDLMQQLIALSEGREHIRPDSTV